MKYLGKVGGNERRVRRMALHVRSGKLDHGPSSLPAKIKTKPRRSMAEAE